MIRAVQSPPFPPVALITLLGWLPLALVLGTLTGCSSPDRGGPGAGKAAPRADGGPAEGPGSEIAKIQEWQRNRDASARDTIDSPFGAVDSQYVNEGVKVTLGADESGIRRDPGKPMPAMAAITYEEKAGFAIDRLPGSAPPRIHGLDTGGEPTQPGADVESARVIGEDEMASVGRFFLTMSPQSGFGRIIAYDPDAEARVAFSGFRWFPADLKFKVQATWVPNPRPDEVTVATTRGLAKTFHRAGHFKFTVDGAPQSLVALADSPVPQPGDSLFLPFRDATTGQETYDVGRYLSVDFLGEGKEHLIDFNHATNPSCNYSPHFNCPLPPDENRLTAAIRAGEMTYPAH